MSLDFQQVRQQIRALVEGAPAREEELRNLRDMAEMLLTKYSTDLEYLQDKVKRAAKLNVRLRCAVPTNEPLIQNYPLPDLPKQATIIAADGSQINPNYHLALQYCLVNVGVIQMELGQTEAPQPIVQSELFYDLNEIAGGGFLSEGMVALMRDQREREVLSELAAEAPCKPVLTFTDGPIELWGREEGLETSKIFEKYLGALGRLRNLKAATAGYVDKPRSDLVVRLLEVGALDENKLENAGKDRWLRGISDVDLYKTKLNPGDRSPVFALQSLSTKRYEEDMRVHFFYLNVSMDADDPELARVEIPTWVVELPELLDALHSVLVAQCQIIGGARHPYILHRAHEIAVVTYEDKRQVDMMISRELREQKLELGRRSAKQIAKDLVRRQPRKKG